MDYEEENILVRKDHQLGFALVGAMAVQSTITYLDEVQAKSISTLLKAITICINSFIQLEQELQAQNLYDKHITQSNSQSINQNNSLSIN